MNNLQADKFSPQLFNSTSPLTTSSLLDEITALGEMCRMKSHKKEEIIEKIQHQLVRLWELSSDEIDLAREALLALFRLQIDEMQTVILDMIEGTINISSNLFARDIEQKKVSFFIDLEKEISAWINRLVRREESQETVIAFLQCYQQVIESLILLNNLVKDSASILTIEQHLPTVLVHTDEWLPFLLKETHSKIAETVREIDNCLKQMSKPLIFLRELRENSNAHLEPASHAAFLGKISSQLNNWKRAEHYYRLAFELCNDIYDPEIFLVSLRDMKFTILGTMVEDYFTYGKSDAATVILSELFTSDTKNGHPESEIDRYLLHGHVFDKQHDERQAELYFDKALGIALSLGVAEHAETHRSLVKIYFTNNRYSKAFSHTEKFVQLSPEKEKEIWVTYGTLLLIRGEFKDSIIFLQKALEQAQTENNVRLLAKIHAQIALAYLGINSIFNFYSHCMDLLSLSAKLLEIDQENYSIEMSRIFNLIGIVHKVVGNDPKHASISQRAFEFSSTILKWENNNEKEANSHHFDNLSIATESLSLIPQKKFQEAVGLLKNELEIEQRSGLIND